MVKCAKFVVFAYRHVKGFFEDWYVVESWIFFFKKKVQNKPNFHKLRKIKIFQLLCLFKGRTTLNHYAFCVIVTIPVEKQMNFAPFGGPVQSSVCLLVPSYDLKKSLKPLNYDER